MPYYAIDLPHLSRPEHAKQLREYAKEELKRLDLADRKEAVHDVVSKVIINGHIEVHVCIKIPVAKKVGLYAEDRNCRPTKRGKIHAF